MILRKDVLDKLKLFGLNSYEAKIWAALLARGSATAGELSEISDVPRSRSYDILESLAKKGFIVLKTGKPIKYQAIPPTEVVERLKKISQASSVEQEKVLQHLQESEIIAQLKHVHAQGMDLVEPKDFTGTLRGKENIAQQLERMLRLAKKSITLSATAQELSQVAVFPALKKAKEKGVDITIFTKLGTKGSLPSLLQDVAEIKQHPAELRFCVVDDQELLFLVTEEGATHPDYETGVWIKSSMFAESLQSLMSKPR
ncbi:TrmB family transcriptional regulator [Candidatus Woesearchaeota archaeon]|nr:TrmB family transcriptional regulator [Candidatus Woesearchaeota archaeon]